MDFISQPAIAYSLPYFACGFGVFVADRLNLYPEMKRAHLYLMSVPVILVIVGILLSNVTVGVSDDSGTITEHCCGHTRSAPGFLLFLGTTAIYGTLIPDLFQRFRDNAWK